VLSWWLWSGRKAAAIGAGVPGGWAFWVGIVVVAALSAALGYQVAVVRGSAVAQAQVRKQFRGVSALVVPRDKFERRMWIGLSLTAAFCEEILYRGFLMWYVIVLHAAVDVTSGLTGSVALGQSTSVTCEGSAGGGQ